MSSDTLRSLYESKAFKPAPSLWELALTHVDLARVGLSPAPEPRIYTGVVAAEGVSLLCGGSGSGKSSVLANVAQRLADETTPGTRTHRYLPVFVPVIGMPEAMDIDAFGRGAIREVLLSLGSALPFEYRKRLERGKAKEIIRQTTGAVFNAKIAAKLFAAGPEAGLRFGSEVTTIADQQGLDSSGGIKTLGDIVRANGLELVLFVEDTDAWAYGDVAGRERARAFFGGLARSLVSDVDVAVAIAVQTHWFEKDPLDEVNELRDRAVTVAAMPRPMSEAGARALVEAVLERRIEVSLPGRSEQRLARRLFADEVLDALALDVLRSGSVRKPLTKVRDVLDRHADALPDVIEMEHILETI